LQGKVKTLGVVADDDVPVPIAPDYVINEIERNLSGSLFRRLISVELSCDSDIRCRQNPSGVIAFSDFRQTNRA